MNKYTLNKVDFIQGGGLFFEKLLQLIDGARNSIHLQTYIFNDDATGTLVADALIRAAGKQVDVYLLVDGYGSQGLSHAFIKKLNDGGVNFRFFEPLFTSKHFYFGRRLHHKVIVVDALQSMVGGMNITDRYNDLPGQQAWFDVALLVEGEISAKLYSICLSFWSNKRVGYWAKSEGNKELVQEKGYHPVRIRRNDWVSRKHEVRNTYSQFFREAKESITIVCSYFLPGQIFRRQIKKALHRGVVVKVVLTGFSDVRIAKYAERYLYRWMLRNGVQLYEYKPSVLHAKMAIADNERLTAGSYNINNISEFVSIEMNLEVNSKPFATKVQSLIDETIKKDCIHIESSSYRVDIFGQFLQWISFQVIRLVLTVTTFYFKEE
jgi:cardiolipin synthase